MATGLAEKEAVKDLGYRTQGRVTRVFDGSTVEFETVKRTRVNLADCWTQRNCREAQQQLSNLCIGRDDLVLFVPEGGEFILRHAFSGLIGRLEIRTTEEDISELMVRTGLAFPTKHSLQKATGVK